MDTIRTRYSLISLLLAGMLTVGCGGGGGGDHGGDGGGGGGNSPPTYTVSGTIQAALGNVVDGDVNDVAAANRSNNTADTAQSIPNPVIVGGHANLPYSGSAGQTYYSGDPYDWYRVTLAANQTIILSIAEDGLFNDLDLILYSTTDLQNPIDESLGRDKVESIRIKQAGEYFIVVKAYSGASNYTLTIGQSSTSSSPQDSGVRLSDPFVPGQVIARFSGKTPTSGTGLQARAQALGLNPVAGEEGRHTLLELPENLERMYQALGVAAKTPTTDDFPLITDPTLRRKHDTLIALKELHKHPDVIAAEPNFIRYPDAVFTPNDQYYPLQWNYPLINLPYAWELNSGANTIVAVIDTGIVKSHPDLQGQLLPGYDFISDPTNAGDGDGIDPDPSDPGDRINPSETSSFHGTHVAGTVAALTNNGIGVAGVAFSSKIMPLRVLGRYGGTDYDIEQAVLYAAGLPNDSKTVPPKRADVINLSLGGPDYSTASQTVFKQARDAGVVIVAAAGNEASTIPSYPAAYDGVIAVSAVTISKSLAPYSNYGSYIAVAAPGGDSTFDLNGDGQPDGVLSTAANETADNRIVPNYISYQGTSMATPHMAGVVALMRSVNPALTPAAIDTLLASGRITMDLGDTGRDDRYGYGLINAYTAVLAAGAPGAPTPILSVNPAALNFGLFRDNISIKVGNSGVGDLKVDVIIPGAGWLSISPVAVDANGLGDYKMTVNRANLTDGIYTAKITFSSSSANTTVQVPVIMQIASLGASDVGTLYVLAVDAASGNTVKGTVATRQSNGTYSYSLSGIPQGKYQIIAGTDANNNNVICDAGEACGAYLTRDKPITIEVNSDQQIPPFSAGFSTNLQNTSSTNTSQGIQGFARNPPNGKELGR